MKRTLGALSVSMWLVAARQRKMRLMEMSANKPLTKAERFRQRWAAAEANVPKFLDELPRAPDDAFADVDDMWEFARRLNPALERGDGDLEEHLRIHDFLMARRAESKS